MDKEKLKLIIRNLELLIDSLKTEVYSDVNSYTEKANLFVKNQSRGLHDYDEIFEDDDGYPN